MNLQELKALAEAANNLDSIAAIGHYFAALSPNVALWLIGIAEAAQRMVHAEREYVASLHEGPTYDHENWEELDAVRDMYMAELDAALATGPGGGEVKA